MLPEVLGRWYTRKHNTPKVDHQPNKDAFAELQQVKTLSSAATQNVPLEVFTFPAYKLLVCLRHGIV